MFLDVSFWQSIFLSFYCCLSFVGSLYVWKGSSTQSRNDVAVIKRRIISIAAVCVIVPTSLFFFNDRTKDGPPFLVWIGITLDGLLQAIFLPLFLTMCLFLGPLCVNYLDGTIYWFFMNNFRSGNFFIYRIDYQKFRNLIAAPFGEELIFRACICAFLIAGGCSLNLTIFMSTFLFGTAHIHHVINHVRSLGYPMKTALGIVGFQAFYTSIFGSYVCFVYLRTGHLISIVVCHSFCNMMGFPDLSWAFDSAHNQYKKRYLIGSMFLIGTFLFAWLLIPLTEPALYNGSFLYEQFKT